MNRVAEPEVSILLPAYQSAAFIKPTLESISAQTHQSFEVVVSVDKGNDATFDVCSAHADTDRRFRVITQERRLGYVGNCNFLLSQARGEFALFAFHDDMIAPSYAEKLAAPLRERPHASMTFSDLELTHTSGEKEHWGFEDLEGVASRVERGLKMLARPQGWWVPNRGMFRMAAARKVQGLKTHSAGEFSTDWPWLFHLSLTGAFIRVPETLCFKFYKPASLSRSWEFTTGQWYAASLSCMREIWTSDLSGEEKLALSHPVMDWLAKNKPQNFLAKPQ